MAAVYKRGYFASACNEGWVVKLFLLKVTQKDLFYKMYKES